MLKYDYTKDLVRQPDFIFFFFEYASFYVSIVPHLFIKTFASFTDLIILNVFTVSLSCSIISSSWDACRNFHLFICCFFFCCLSLTINCVLTWFVTCFTVKSSSTCFFQELGFHSGMWQHRHRGFLHLLSRLSFYAVLWFEKFLYHVCRLTSDSTGL